MAGYWLFYTINDAGKTVELGRLPSEDSDRDVPAVEARLRELVSRDLSASELMDAWRVPGGGVRFELQRLVEGFAMGTGPQYVARFYWAPK